MINNLIEILYERYNEFSHYEYTVKNPYTLIRILNEGNIKKEVLEKKIIEYEVSNIKIGSFQKLVMEKDFAQPKSIMLRFFYLNLVVATLPDYFYLDIKISRESILHVSIAIAMYYFGLQTYKFGSQSTTERKNLIGRDDFVIGLTELQKVCGEISEQSFYNYLKLFAKDVNDISDSDNVRFYIYKDQLFILCIEEFLDYIQYEIERIFKVKCDDRAYSYYTRAKGYAFENMVYGMLAGYFNEIYHTMFYYPNTKQKIEVDIIVRENSEIVIFECKSGTLDARNIDNDDIVKIKIKSKVKDAYRSLKTVSDYIINTIGYIFKNTTQEISGESNDPVCIHIAMYPFDFVSSNVHVLFPELENQENPILTISFEHLLAILVDVKKKNRCIFDYWKQRKEDIRKYPGKKFDNNELDLYYEIVNADKNTMLSEIKKSGILDQISKHAEILSTFRDVHGNETRPAIAMIKELESFLISGILRNGKKWFGINKRYLRNLEELIKIH